MKTQTQAPEVRQLGPLIKTLTDILQNRVRADARTTRKYLRMPVWIAQIARLALEDYAARNNYIPNLQGMCAIAGALICKLAKDHSLEAAVAYGTFVNRTSHNRGKQTGHCWAIVGTYPNSVVIDVTATQFSPQLSRLIIQSINNAPNFRAERIFKGRSGIERFVNDEGWALNAIPRRRLVDRLAREALAITDRRLRSEFAR